MALKQSHYLRFASKQEPYDRQFRSTLQQALMKYDPIDNTSSDNQEQDNQNALYILTNINITCLEIYMDRFGEQCLAKGEADIKTEEEVHLNSDIDFPKFVQSIGPAAQVELDFEALNCFIKINQKDYLPFIRLIDYYQQVFSRKTNVAKRLKWHSKDKFVLLWVISKYCDIFNIEKFRMVQNLFVFFLNSFSDQTQNRAHWEDISSILKLDRRFLMRKWICMLRHTTCLFQWSKSEQIILQKQMRQAEYESNWSELSLKIFEQTDVCFLRTCKDIRQRWKNYLDPKLKRISWSEQEDDTLVDLIKLHGKKWSLIAKTIEGRTQNQVKNRFITLFKKRRMSIGPQATKSEDDSKFIKKEESQKLNLPQFSPDYIIPPYSCAQKIEGTPTFDGQIFVQQVLQKDTDHPDFFSEFTLF